LGGALAASSLGAQATAKIKFEKYTLPNGLEVILHEDHSTPIVSVDTWYHVGSGDEQIGRTGFAHLFEHIMFMGSQNVPVGAFDQMLEAAGADNNGSTNEDRTNYYENLPSNALALALWLDADRMGFLLPTMDLAKLNLQRDVVKNERRQRVDNVPYGRADETILAALYPPSHPYSWPVIGSMADLSAASVDDVKNFFRTYYAPNNATVAIAGDFDPAAVKKLVAQYFGPIPRGPAVKRRTTVPAVVIPRDKFIVLEDKVQLPRLFYTWPSVKLYAPDDAALDILALVLANDKNSRLYKKLVSELQIAQNPRAFPDSRRHTDARAKGHRHRSGRPDGDRQHHRQGHHHPRAAACSKLVQGKLSRPSRQCVGQGGPTQHLQLFRRDSGLRSTGCCSIRACNTR
jgi:zinc protease